MVRFAAIFAVLVSSLAVSTGEEKPPSYPSFDYDVAQKHEIKPHRRTIPSDGIGEGFNQLHLTLTVSPVGDVVDARASGDNKLLEIWPQLEGEVRSWKFEPFEKDGKPVTAEVEEYVDLVPPERLPTKHVIAPAIRPNSSVKITLERTGCYGTCPAYTVTVSTDGISFDGRSFVVTRGNHHDVANADDVRSLAKQFISADFYSMDASYQASVTDSPSFVVAIDIDGQRKQIIDYVGSWVGMPAIITQLEEKVDEFADTDRWVKGSDGLVESLRAEKFDFHTFAAQVILKEAATRGETATVSDLLEAGVPLKPLPAPKPKQKYETVPFDHVGWLNAASAHPETLQVLIDAAASKNDQSDKDLALANAARSGSAASAKALIAYGANPNVDLNKLTMTESGGGMTIQREGSGSVLIEAARSGQPDVVQEILRYSPNVEARDREGKTALFAAGEFSSEAEDSSRAECIKLLAEAGADVNARDDKGNTPLHETFILNVEEELLKLGADVNARNKDGETPIFTTYDDRVIPLLMKRGADLTIRNNKGDTVVEAAKGKGPTRQAVLRDAIAQPNQR
jgi:ankyrin repeat protein